MDYRTIVEKHPDRYVIAAVAERGENNFVSSWEVLSADSKSFNEAKEKLKFFESEGVKCCCIDKSKLSVIKLDKLDSFIDSVVPKTICEEEDKDFSRVTIDVSEFF